MHTDPHDASAAVHDRRSMAPDGALRDLYAAGAIVGLLLLAAACASPAAAALQQAVMSIRLTAEAVGGV